MDKETIKAFIAWLESATEEEILQRREQALIARLDLKRAKSGKG